MSKQVFLVLKPLGGVNIYFLFKLIFVVIATISMETLFLQCFRYYSTFYSISILQFLWYFNL